MEFGDEIAEEPAILGQNSDSKELFLMFVSFFLTS